MNATPLTTNKAFILLSTLAAWLLWAGTPVMAQVEVKGTVYDMSQYNGMQGVSVLGTSGVGAETDTVGHYHIRLPEGDSIYFSYLGKTTRKFLVKDIDNPLKFDISLPVSIQTLAPILVAPNGYHLDSLENRRENANIFDYGRGSTLDNMKSNRGKGFGMGFDFDQFFNGQARIDKSRESVQRWFVVDEQEKYVDHRFSKAIVRRITNLPSPALEAFMKAYRPSYEMIQSFSSDWDFYQYIMDSGKTFWAFWTQEKADSVRFSTWTKFGGMAGRSDTTDGVDSSEAGIPGVR